MGSPKKQRKKYDKPKRPFDKVRIEEERKVMRDYGLRRKKEIWRNESILRDFRRRARKLQASRNEKLEKELLSRLVKLGLVKKGATLDDILYLKLEDVLARRLQTIVAKKGFSPKHARQLIVHGHVFVAGRKNKWPNFLISQEDEEQVALSPLLQKMQSIQADQRETKGDSVGKKA